MRLPVLLRLLGSGVGLAWGLAWLGAAFAGLLVLLALFNTPGAGVGVMLVGLLLSLMFAQGLGHLRAALHQAGVAGPLDGEVAEQVRQGGQWLLLAGVAALLLLLLLPWLGPDAVATLWTPSSLLSTLLGLAFPLLLIGLSGWLDEGRRLRDRAREVV